VQPGTESGRVAMYISVGALVVVVIIVLLFFKRR
jgi:hypothetical protein